jgi:hypothetical protein
MRAYLSRLSPFTLTVLSIPVLIMLHTVLSVAAPTIIRVVLPQTVRAALHIV